MSTQHADLIALIEPLARMFFGEPNRRRSSQTELRFGTHGSLSIDLTKGTWYDHETNEGGGTLDLVMRQKGFTEPNQCFDWMEGEGLWTNGRVKPNGRGLLDQEVAHYDYLDEAGNLLYQVVRFEPKDFRQRKPNGQGGWTWNISGVRQVPYRLPELMEALANDHTVFVVEGEKDVDNLWHRNIPGTTNAMGAGKWNDSLNQFFIGADVVVIADNDPQAKNKRTGELLYHDDGRPKFPGQVHAHEVAAELIEIADRVRVLDLGKHWKECPTKGDVSNFFEAGLSVEELNSIVEQLPDWMPEQAARIGDIDGQAFRYSWHWIWHGEIDAVTKRSWVVELLLPEIGTCLISGQWGTYKTFVADDLAASVMTGTPFINFPIVRKGGVLFLACEGQNEVAIRLTAAYEARGGTGKAPFAWVENCPRLLDPNASKILAAMVKQAGAKMMRDFGLPVAVVIIDTAGKAAGLRKDGQLNDDAVAKVIMKALDDASRETGALFVGVAHFGKNVETGTKGSTGFEDDADVVLALLGDRTPNGIVANPRLCLRKRKSGPNGEEFPFQTGDAQLGDEKTLIIRWSDPAQASGQTSKPKKDDPWTAKSLRLLRQVLMNMLADCGQDMRPYPDGPLVRAVDQEIVRAEFYKSYPAEGDAEAKKAARQRAFRRAVLDAQAKWLIGVRDVGAITYVWLATPTTTQTSQTSARSNGSGSSGAHVSPTCSSYEILGPASAGERCALCGKAGALRIKHGGGVDLWHEGCAKQYFAAMDDPPVKVPDPGPMDEHGAPMDTD